jgi:hypothetical protein
LLKVGKLQSTEVSGRRRVVLDEVGEAAPLDVASRHVDFVWGLEMAHESDITSVQVSPQGVLTGSTDRCTRMCTSGGTPVGLLQQSIKVGTRSARWNLEVDVGARLSIEASLVRSAMTAVADQRAPEQVEAASRKNASESKPRRPRGTKASRSGTWATAKDRQQQNERDRAHKRVLSVLANVKDIGASIDRAGSAAVVNTAHSLLVGDPRLRDKNRRLPDHLKKLDPMLRPPMELTGLGPGLGTAFAAPTSSSPRLPQISVKSKGRSSRGDVGEDVIASMERLQAKLRDI